MTSLVSSKNLIAGSHQSNQNPNSLTDYLRLPNPTSTLQRPRIRSKSQSKALPRSCRPSKNTNPKRSVQSSLDSSGRQSSVLFGVFLFFSLLHFHLAGKGKARALRPALTKPRPPTRRKSHLLYEKVNSAVPTRPLLRSSP